jgi:metallo-beta-lactamase family protein
VARGQLLISLIHQYFTDHPEEKIRVVIDGPMMVEANKVYREFSEETKIPILLRNALSDIEIIDNESEWVSLQKKDGPLIIISSSGMVSGGRIWRHLENWQSDPNACLFLPGYQAEGTAGRILAEGKRIVWNDKEKLHWRGEVITSEAFSSHADQNELIAWLRNVSKEAHIYLNHGESAGKIALKKKLNGLGFNKVEIAKNSSI